jgi:hypothetical protein
MHGSPIGDTRVKGAVDPGIGYSMRFAEWEALVEAGATVDELYKYEKGEYPKWFRAMMVGWKNMHDQVKMHAEAAAAEAAERKAKKK